VARRGRQPQRDDGIEVVNGIEIGNHRVPLWLMLVVVGVIAWGLTYLITYTVKGTGSFEAPGIIGLLR
jgi:cbb3-type cytochrome oxidase subunit FixP-like protein